MPTRIRFLVALTALPCAALATTVMALSVEEMAQRAPLVVRATANQSQATWDAQERGIWTYTELAVQETLKGAPAAGVIVKQPGGVVGARGTSVAGAARFAPGEEVVLFLEPAADEKGVYLVLGLAAGKVSVEDRLGTRSAVRHLDGLAFARPGGGAVRPVGAVEVIGPADAFLERVRRAVKGGAR